MQEALTAAQQAEAQKRAETFAQAASAEFLPLARTLVATGPTPYGQTEFTARNILLHAGAKVDEQYWAEQ